MQERIDLYILLRNKILTIFCQSRKISSFDLNLIAKDGAGIKAQDSINHMLNIIDLIYICKWKYEYFDMYF